MANKKYARLDRTKTRIVEFCDILDEGAVPVRYTGSGRMYERVWFDRNTSLGTRLVPRPADPLLDDLNNG
jgi:hypothetical protein